jgi:D-alanine-D-alanine ligase
VRFVLQGSLQKGVSIAVEHLKVVILYNYAESLIKGEPKDLVADLGVVACAREVTRALESAGLRVQAVAMTGEVEQALAPYPPTEWVVFNLAEGLAGRLFEEVRIAWALEVMGYRFTGADAVALALSTHKARAKAALLRAGVPTPEWRLFSDPAQVTAETLEGLVFPLIAKPVAEDASLGIGTDAVVESSQELRQRVRTVVEHYRQAALVETFVDGREFNVSIWDDPPTVLPLSEVHFPAARRSAERIVSFPAKWEPDSVPYQNTPVTCPAVVSPELAQAITDAALRAWCAIGCRGYARVDMRVDQSELPNVIEVNCNPDISPDAGFFRSVSRAGLTFDQMALHILCMALKQAASDD